MSIDLKKLEHKLDEALSNETTETLTKFLTDKRMTNNKQSSVEWLCEKLALKLGVPMAISFYIDHAEEIKQVRAMHKEEVKQTYFDGWHRNIGNRDEDFEQYYNETYGGNNEQQ